jgi:hypothetical protein
LLSETICNRAEQFVPLLRFVDSTTVITFFVTVRTATDADLHFSVARKKRPMLIAMSRSNYRSKIE